jgi:putative transcription factor
MKLSCDICGRPDARAVILVEGAKMVACAGCVRMGKILYRLDEGEESETLAIKMRPRSAGPMEESEEVVEGYGRIIKKARDKAGLKLEVIAEKINERESYVDAIENGRMKPPLAVARKLERELGVKLVEKVVQEEPTESKPSGRFSEPTLGDMLAPAKRKKGK